MPISKEDFNTGDILLFHNEGKYNSCYNCFFSCFTGLIQCCTKSQFSHAAMVIRDPQFTDPPLKGLYVLESSFETFPDVEDHKYKLGVELEEFDKVIASAEEHETIYWRKLECNRDAQFYQQLAKAHAVVHNKPYDLFPKDWINALIHKQNASDGHVTSRFFCSALVAYMYCQWNFLPSTVEWSLVTPKMLSSECPNADRVPFQNCVVKKDQQLFVTTRYVTFG